METPKPQLSLPHGVNIKLDPGEQVLRVIRQSPFALVPVLIVSLFLEAVAVGLGYVVGNMPELIPIPAEIALALITIATLLAGIILLVGLFIYRRNSLVFTNRHLIIREQLSLFYSRTSQVSFVRVQDVTGQRRGLFQTIFNFGDVIVQSAGEQEKFIFHYAPNPEVVADDALQQHEHTVQELRGQSEDDDEIPVVRPDKPPFIGGNR
jgi:membrane protein YdbS with pleckstrin-like domain